MNYIKRLYNFIANIPPGHLKQDRQSLGKENFLLHEDLSRVLSKDDEKPIVILGPWGAGKSTQVRAYGEKFNKNYKFEFISFFSIQDLDQAYMHLIPYYRRIIFYLAVVLLFFLFSKEISDWKNKFEVLILVFGSVSYLILTNKFKIFYFLMCALDFLFELPTSYFPCVSRRSSRIKVIVIEDLDRSSMSDGDKWGLLSNLWHYKKKYIIELGYSDSTSGIQYREIALKLESNIIDIRPNMNINRELIASRKINFPLKEIEWLQCLNPRKLINLLDDIEVKLKKKNTKNYYVQLFLIINCMIYHFLEEISALNDEEFLQIRASYGNDKIQIFILDKKLDAYQSKVLDCFNRNLQSEINRDLILLLHNSGFVNVDMSQFITDCIPYLSNRGEEKLIQYAPKEYVL